MSLQGLPRLHVGPGTSFCMGHCLVPGLMNMVHTFGPFHNGMSHSHFSVTGSLGVMYKLAFIYVTVKLHILNYVLESLYGCSVTAVCELNSNGVLSCITEICELCTMK